jgi:integral membrane protein
MSGMPLLRTPSRLYRLLALAEMVTWTLLLLGMLLKYVLQVTELGVRIGGGLHGFVFLSYVVVTVLVAVDQRWSVGRLAMGVGSALIPYLTVPFEQWAHRRGLLGDSWRLREDAPRSLPERVAALALRRPVLAAVIAVVVVAVVFSVLLSLGPPTEWFA